MPLQATPAQEPITDKLITPAWLLWFNAVRNTLNDILVSSGVISVNGSSGIVVLDSDDIAQGATNFYITNGDKTDITVSGATGNTWTIDNLAVTNAKISDVAWGKITGTPTTLAGYSITGTKAQFDTACSDGNFLYVGDVTQYTDEMAQDATGAMATSSTRVTLTYNDGGNTLTPDLVSNTITAGYLSASATDKLFGRSAAGAGAGEEIACTSFGRALIDDASVAAQRTTLGIAACQVGFTVGDGTNVITTGIRYAAVRMPFAMTITSVEMVANESGSIVIDIWKDTYANWPPTVADTIVASAKPTITTATKSVDSTLTGWSTSLAAGDYLIFKVDSITSCKQVVLTLIGTRA